jgi:hypothetical protein
MFQDLLTNYIDLFSLAQGNAGAHQEYQPIGEDCVLRFPEQNSWSCGKLALLK